MQDTIQALHAMPYIVDTQLCMILRDPSLFFSSIGCKQLVPETEVNVLILCYSIYCYNFSSTLGLICSHASTCTSYV